MTTQIRYAGMNGWPTGIEHQAVWPIIDQFVALRGDDCPRGYRLGLFDQFRVLEDSAIAELQERQKIQMRKGPGK